MQEANEEGAGSKLGGCRKQFPKEKGAHSSSPLVIKFTFQLATKNANEEQEPHVKLDPRCRL